MQNCIDIFYSNFTCKQDILVIPHFFDKWFNYTIQNYKQSHRGWEISKITLWIQGIQIDKALKSATFKLGKCCR